MLNTYDFQWNGVILSTTILEVRGVERSNKGSSTNVERQKLGMVWKVGRWKVKARGSYHRFRSQTGLSAKSRMGAHELRLQVCRLNGPKPRKNKSRNKSYVSSINYQQ